MNNTAAAQRIALPACLLIIVFLVVSSQWLFVYIEPGPLTTREFLIFNTINACVLICYARTCLTDPGRVPQSYGRRNSTTSSDEVTHRNSDPAQRRSETQMLGSSNAPRRWCRKCSAWKPPRAHHCRTCQRCIVKMDHHCMWTANCVSGITLPHFVRFIFYSVLASAYLERLIYTRCEVIYLKRSLPSYFGPSMLQFTILFILIVTNSIVLLGLFLLLCRTLWGLALNMTTIEGWEVDRHETLLRRSRVLSRQSGDPSPLVRQEFPWDIGIWSNICQGMGDTGNVFAWFWPFSATPPVTHALEFEHNCIDDPNLPWPPPDPDRVAAERLVRRRPFHERLQSERDCDDSGEEGWQNSQGERLADFGVDELVDFYDVYEDEDVPLAELLRRD
ncbi:zf-DHHC-domain-containing protein [Piedraia hortae CBS 480.64]|uniref:Palmitoyltransferase PFA4 n=1 Tax=Piedraia hortae CBS 480.64 TaxID=1314780 RepID=A0A6A7BWA9_9PEZI|nr:zf-DHHC-domain-containing protein [Piedraia hortae CBS 480.64]